MENVIPIDLDLSAKAHGYLVKLWWRGSHSWGEEPTPVCYTFRCIGANYGPDRWSLHMAEADKPHPRGKWDSPGLSKLLRQCLQDGLARYGNNRRTVSQFQVDRILWPSRDGNQ